VTLTLLGLSSVFLVGCDNRPTPEQRQAWLQDQENQAAKSLSPDEQAKANQEYQGWTAEQKDSREKESRMNGYREDSGLPWWVYWMLFSNLISRNNGYTGFRPNYYYSRPFQDYQTRLNQSRSSSGSFRSGGFSGSHSYSSGGGVSRGGFGSSGGHGAGE
jgi:hypothetical protein